MSQLFLVMMILRKRITVIMHHFVKEIAVREGQISKNFPAGQRTAKKAHPIKKMFLIGGGAFL